ncbi:MAG: HAMP domain-containing histidine kinase [Myxococcales bacterium]|nr:HAMP domain-containing histidine kinase [Myxococcales bacterium]
MVPSPHHDTPPGAPARPPGADPWPGDTLRLADVPAMLALCDERGHLLAASPPAEALLVRLGAVGPELPAGLWPALAAVDPGDAIQWRPADGTLCLGCTRYRLGDGRALILMREVSDKQRALAQRVHEQRLEATGSLVAAIAHDIRGALSSVLFNADVLVHRTGTLDPAALRPFLLEILGGAERLKQIVDGLLHFARLGPQVAPDTPIDQILTRALAVVRPRLRDRPVTLAVGAAPPDLRVKGNPLHIEQILVNLLHNAVESQSGPLHVRIDVERRGDGTVRVRVGDDGPGIAPDLQPRVFDPFFTTKPFSTGLGLSTGREAARQLGGDLALLPSDHGACFGLVLPAAAESPR